VEDALRAVGQGFTSVGAKDPRKTVTVEIDFRIQRQLRSWSREDDPPTRVEPIPIQLILTILSIVYHTTTTSTDAAKAIADMTVITFYYLLRPGEYTGPATDDAAFRLQDLQLFIGDRFVDPSVAPISDLEAATYVSLVFTNQKNGVRGEVVNHATSGASHCCPARALARRAIHLRTHDAPPATPLASYYSHGRHRAIRSADITDALRAAARITGDELGIRPDDTSARSLRAGGAIALLCAQVDSDIIKLLGRWQSDTMMHYLHVQARPIMRNFTARMLHGGAYDLVHNPAFQNPQAPNLLHTNIKQTNKHQHTTVPTLHRLAVDSHHPCTTHHYVPTLQHSLASRHHVPIGSRRRQDSLVKSFNPHPLLLHSPNL
jgi:hypothetical protein